MLTTLYAFVGNSRAYGSGGPVWVGTGAEPRLLAVDGAYLTASMPVIMNDTDSLDGLTWKKADGTIMPWQDKLITYVSFFIQIKSNVPGVTIGMAVANSSLGGAANIGNQNLSLPPDTMTLINMANGEVSAPPTLVNWRDYARDHIRNQDLLFSLIASNRFGVAPWIVEIHQMYLEVTWSYLRQPGLITEY